MRTRLLLLSLFAFAGVLSAQVSIGIQIGPPPPPRAYAMQPAAPGPGFLWIEGYWYPVGHRYHWHSGYWTQPPYAGAEWAPARYEGSRYFAGYWNGPRGRFEHDHHWDRDRKFRDGGRGEDHDRDRGNGHDRGRGHDRDHARDHDRN